MTNWYFKYLFTIIWHIRPYFCFFLPYHEGSLPIPPYLFHLWVLESPQPLPWLSILDYLSLATLTPCGNKIQVVSIKLCPSFKHYLEFDNSRSNLQPDLAPEFLLLYLTAYSISLLDYLLISCPAHTAHKSVPTLPQIDKLQPQSSSFSGQKPWCHPFWANTCLWKIWLTVWSRIIEIPLDITSAFVIVFGVLACIMLSKINWTI